MSSLSITTALPPGREPFTKSLRTECNYLLGQVVRDHLKHADYLALRDTLFRSHAWKRATNTARTEALAYLSGSIEMLFLTCQIVWAHRIDGEWVRSGTKPVDYARIERSAHIWASDSIEFYPLNSGEEV